MPVSIAEAGANDTLTLTGVEVLPANGPLALKAAVMLCEPVLNEAVLKLALPSASSPSVPSTVIPSKKVAPPNGTPAGEDTLSVRVTTVPAAGEGLEVDSKDVVAFAVTVTIVGEDVLAAKKAAV